VTSRPAGEDTTLQHRTGNTEMLNLVSENTKEFPVQKSSFAAHAVKHRHFILNGASGDLHNDEVRFCYTCRNRGWPHEAIEFEKINGRLRNDGSYEALGWRLRNYFDGREHQHKQRRSE
jgi:hypothetical protein